jgi:cyanate permease
MRTRAPQSALGWTIYFGVLAAVSATLFLKAPDVAERLKSALTVLWLAAVVFFVLWRFDRRRSPNADGSEASRGTRGGSRPVGGE